MESNFKAILVILLMFTRSGYVMSEDSDSDAYADAHSPCHNSPCTCTLTKDLWIMDCSWRELDAVPKIDLNTSYNIVELNLSGGFLTKLKDYAFRGMSTLKNLNLNHNNIIELEPYSFYGLEETLEELDLSHNQVSNVSALRGLKNIKWLSLRMNHLTTAGADVFSGLGRRLEIMDLSQNRMESMPQSLQFLDHLKALFFNWNKLEEIDVNVLNGMKNLENLEMAENKIKSIPAQTFKTMDLLFRVSLAGNEIDDISPQAFYGLDYNLRQINLSFNHLKRLQFCAFRGLQLLEILVLNGNPFTCDCLLVWYRNARLPHAPFPAATCAEPAKYTGLQINSFPHDACSIQDMYLWGTPCDETGSLPMGSTVTRVTSRPTGTGSTPAEATTSPIITSSNNPDLLTLVYIALAIAVFSVLFSILFAVMACTRLKKYSAMLKLHAKRLEMPTFSNGGHVHFRASACDSTMDIATLQGYEQAREEGYNYINPYGPTYETIPITNTFTNHANSVSNHR